jgi:Cu/Ag efflux protein CusF
MHTHPRRGGLIVACLLATGCATYRLPALDASHPAHPDARTPRADQPSRTLAYVPGDKPSAWPVAPPIVSPVSPREGHAMPAARASTAQTVVGVGEVVTTGPGPSQIVVDHEAITGFMEAMTMGYRVDAPALLEGLKPGDRIRFTIDVAKRAITAIEKLH